MTETLMHYHEKPFTFRHDYSYKGYHPRRDKPTGFWVSVLGEYDWPTWCSNNDWGDTSVAYRVDLTPTANILRITTLEQLIEFHHEYDPGHLEGTNIRWGIDWPRVYAKYDGIIISPYRWDARDSFRTPLENRLDIEWYYGYDCASGCIWNLDAIATVTHVPQEATTP